MGIVVTDITKSFGDPPTYALNGITLKIEEGEFVSLSGKSGSGKSTLLYILSSLDNPSKGQVQISGRDVISMSSDDLYEFRNQKMGFIFQFHYLIGELTTLENVLMPARKFQQETEKLPEARALLEQFDLHEKASRYPRQLSGGEQQRVAIARALLMKPKYLFADEPTGSLDTANAEKVMTIIKEVNKAQGTTVVLVTHDPDYAAMAPRQIHLADGRVTKDQ